MIRYMCDGCGKSLDVRTLTSGDNAFTIHTVYPMTGVGIGFMGGGGYRDLAPPLHFCDFCINDNAIVQEAKDRNWVTAAGGKRSMGKQ